ncbi:MULTISPECIES: amidohydrolase [unclassified Haematobacter]|uniref:amidohydrolase n=1 Tax=unclassified Haematobacter TaxID=2640585 RepID=UPI0025B906EB|nr:MULTISPECIES: amidohydrolase [unclassified Haematobacter]
MTGFTGAATAPVAADLIITNARVLTMDTDRPRAEAVAIARGRILAVGLGADILHLQAPGTEVIDAGGRTLLPGFVESHLHLLLGGLELDRLHLGGVRGREALTAAFRCYASKHPHAPLLMAHGATYDILDHPVTRHDLDAVIADRPVAMMAADHHTVWANTAALEAAGLLRGAETPPGHVIVMGPDGLATGELREFEAFGPVLDLDGTGHLQLGIATGEEPDPWPDAARRAADKQIIAAGLAHCARHGITTMVNMDGNRYTLTLLREMEEEGRLTARVVVPFHFKPHMDLSALDRASTMSADFSGAWLRSGFVKMFMDGVLESRTAFLLQDYANHPGERGEALFSAERFAEICKEIDRRGLQIAVHAIGDAAVRRTIDGYEAARRANGARDSRHRIEHIELIDTVDVPRLAANGITASLQPSHPPGAMDFPLATMEAVMPAALWRTAYLCRTLAETGTPLAFGSDWPVADVDVLRSLSAQGSRGPYPAGVDERVSLMEALRAYTAGGAWAAHLDHLTGRLTPGFAADLVLLDADIEAFAPEEYPGAGVRLTIAGGRIVYRA